MSGTAFNHDGVLDDSERIAQADKCVKNLLPHFNSMAIREAEFVGSVKINLGRTPGYAPTMKQLNWLKDLCEKYDR